MALTTVVRGRAYDWTHAIGRGAATGTGFNYVQTMCLGNDGDIYTANRGNENNFGMRVNRIKIGGPGDEELVAEFFQHGEGDGKATWPFGVAVGRTVMCTARMSGPTRSRCSIPTASSVQVRQDRQRRWRTAAPGGPCGREERQRHRGGQRQQPASGVHPGRQAGRHRAARRDRATGEFNQPWGITLDKAGNIYVADWKNHRVQKLSPQGHS